MNRIGLILLILFGYNLSAQQILKESIDSGGGIVETAGIQIIHTLGEVVVAEKTTGNVHVSEGFISLKKLLSLGIEDFTLLKGVNVFPNPTTQILNIDLPEIGNYSIELYDLAGKQITKMLTVSSATAVLKVEELPNATYLVIIKDEANKQLKTFKIIKD